MRMFCFRAVRNWGRRFPDTIAPVNSAYVTPRYLSGNDAVRRSDHPLASSPLAFILSYLIPQELESELSAEDIIFFRTMAEREEAQKFGRVRKGVGNRWSISGWVRLEEVLPQRGEGLEHRIGPLLPILLPN